MEPFTTTLTPFMLNFKNQVKDGRLHGENKPGGYFVQKKQRRVGGKCLGNLDLLMDLAVHSDEADDLIERLTATPKKNI